MCGAAARLCLVALALGTAPLHAGVLDRVRHERLLRCGAEPRSGVAEHRGDGTLGGVAVDLCRRVAVSLFGEGGRVAFRLYRSAGDFGPTRAGGDELAFLTREAIAAQPPGGGIVPGPAVFTVRLSLLVASASPARRPQDLAGRPICFMIGSDAQHALDAAFHGRRLGFLHMGFEEEAEMEDAYAVGRCAAMAGEATELARLADGAGVNRLDSRILPQPLATVPLLAATPGPGAAWAAYVCRVLTRRADGC